MTERLYHDDCYAVDFQATVIEISPLDKRFGVILDRTFFYPTSGGQPCDLGWIGESQVVEVVEEDGRIIHMLAGKPGFKVGDKIEARIDWQRRFLNMQQHTGQHILSQAFERVLGATTVSSSLGVEHSTIDISRLGLTWNDIERVEKLANTIVFENRPVRIYYAKEDEVKDLRMKKKLDVETLRIVEVEDFDKSPCGGTHCRRTGEVGLIKVLRWEKVRDTTRVEFICGMLALEDYFWKTRFIGELSQEMTTKDRELPRIIQGIHKTNRDLRKEVEVLKGQLLDYKAKELAQSAQAIGEKKVIKKVLENFSPGDLRYLAAVITKDPGYVVLLASTASSQVHFVFARSDDVEIDMREAIKAACGVVGGRGGGKPNICQGGGKNPQLATQALTAALEALGYSLA